MTYAEEVLKLRQKFSNAVKLGVISKEGEQTFEAILLQIMNDAEKNRQNCVSQAENLRKQACILDGQANAFASVSSIVFNVLGGYISLAEKDQEEQLSIKEEQDNSKLIQKQASKSKNIK